MKVTLDLPVRYMDVGSDGKLRINALLAYLQEAAIWHAGQCGDGPDEMRQRGAGWALIKQGVQIEAGASYGDILTVETWSRGSSGLKAFREFIVRRKDQVIAKGTSVWVYLNIESGRMIRIEASHMDKYTREPGLATDIYLDQWKPDSFGDADYVSTIRTRSQDFDTNQHVNNTQYSAFVDAALRQLLGKQPSYRQILLAFDKPIGADQRDAEVHVAQQGEKVLFTIHADGTIRCRGQAILTPFEP